MLHRNLPANNFQFSIMKKLLSDILCAIAMTVIAVVACALIAMGIGICAVVMACVVLPIVGCCVWGWCGWWCLLYIAVAVAIFLIIRNEPANDTPQ